MPSFDYQRASSLQEALDLAAASKGVSAFMAGGTDLLVQIKGGKRQPQRLIDVKGIREMEGVTLSDKEVSVGAVTTIRALETSPVAMKSVPLLAEASSHLGSVQIRHRATIGGNLCNASPSAETAPALLALGAKAVIRGKTGSRVVDLDRFFTGPGATVLTGGELLTELKIPLAGLRQGSVYYKLSARKAMDLAFVGVAIHLELGEDDRITRARIGLGAVAPTPIRAVSAEKRVEGGRLTSDTARESAALAAETCQPISDHRASAEYRREMVRKLCEKGLFEAYSRATSLAGGKNG